MVKNLSAHAGDTRDVGWIHGSGYGSIQGLAGQVCVFGVGKSPKYYTDLYPKEETKDYTPSKAVLGVTPAVVGSVEANQVLQLITGIGTPLVNRLWTIDLYTMESHVFDL